MKKRIHAALAVLLLAALLLQACAKTDLMGGITLPQITPTGEGASDVSAEPAAQVTLPEREIVQVFDIGGLLRAIGDNREIVIAAGTYVLPDDGGLISATGAFQQDDIGEPLYGNEKVTISNLNGNAGITIRGVSNMKIRAEDSSRSATPVTLMSVAAYCNGLVFLECNDIDIANIAFTRERYVGGGTYDAMLLFSDCTDVSVTDCTFGCEYVRTAVEAINVDRMTVERIYVTESLLNQMIITDCADISVKNSTFEWSNGSFEFDNATDVEFSNVHFLNGGGDVMFTCWDEVSDVTLRGCVFDGSYFPLLTNSERVKFFDYSFGESIAYFTESGDFAIDKNGVYTGTKTQYITMEYALELMERIITGKDIVLEICGYATYDDEQVYEIHAYNDMPEHTATLGWYYVGLSTARVWETTYGDPIEIATGEAALGDETLFEAFWESRYWIDVTTFPYDETTITNLVLFDLDGNGSLELLIEAELDYGEIYSGYFALRGNKPVELLSAFTGSAHGGTQVLVRIDSRTDRQVVGYYTTMSGVAGDCEYYSFYELADGKLKRLVSFDYDAYYSGYDDSYHESYTVDGRESNRAEFDKLVERFGGAGHLVDGW